MIITKTQLLILSSNVLKNEKLFTKKKKKNFLKQFLGSDEKLGESFSLKNDFLHTSGKKSMKTYNLLFKCYKNIILQKIEVVCIFLLFINSFDSGLQI